MLDLHFLLIPVPKVYAHSLCEWCHTKDPNFLLTPIPKMYAHLLILLGTLSPTTSLATHTHQRVVRLK